MWSAEWSKKPLYYMFVSIYKTIARFSPLDFTIGHGGMFTIRQRPLCRYYSTVFYFFIVLHGNATGKLIRFFIKNIASIYCCFVSIFLYFCMNNILNTFLALDHGGEGGGGVVEEILESQPFSNFKFVYFWLTNKYFCWLDCLRPIQGHNVGRHSTCYNFAGF